MYICIDLYLFIQYQWDLNQWHKNQIDINQIDLSRGSPPGVPGGSLGSLRGL